MNRQVAVLLGVAFVAVALAGAPEFRRHQAMQESLRYLPPNMRFYELDRLGLTPRSPAPELAESTGLRLAGKWGAGPSVKVTGRDSLLFLSRGSQVAVINYADTADPQVLSYIEVNGLVSRSVLVGDRLYVGSTGSDPKYIDVFDVTDPASPERLCSLQTRLLDIDVVDTLVYTVAKDSFRVFDFSDPDNPKQIGACRDSGYTLSVCNGYAYIADRWGLYVVDVRNPTSPHHEASWGTNVIGVKARGNICCATTDNQSNPGVLKFTILDVRTPANPTPFGSLDSCGAYDVFLDGQLAFLSGYAIFNEFRIVDISDSTHPHHVGTAPTPDQNFGVWENPAKNLAYVADDFGGLIVIDIANLNVPVARDMLMRAGLSEEVQLQGRYAYVANEGVGLKVLDVSDPRSPTEVGSVDSTRTVATEAVAVRDSFAFIGWATHPLLRVVDVSDPRNPRKVAAGDVFNPARDMVWRDSFLYVAEPYRLQVVNVARPPQPVLVGTCVLQNDVVDLWLKDSLAYLSSYPSYIVNVADPGNPVIVGNISSGTDGIAVIRDTYAVVTPGFDSIVVYNVSIPSTPYPVASLTLSGGHQYVDDVELMDGDTIAAIGGDYLHLVDVRNPLNPREICRWIPPNDAYRLSYVAPYLYAACWDAGVCVLETTAVGVEEPAPVLHPRPAIQVAPSVTSGRVRVSGSSGNGIHDLRLYDIAGKEVMGVAPGPEWSRAGSVLTVNLAGLPAGVYVFRGTVYGQTTTAKVVKTLRR
jgi:hypothetical protein